MAQSLLSTTPLGLHLHTSQNPGRLLLVRRSVAASAHARRLPALRAAQPVQDEAKVTTSDAAAVDSSPLKGLNLPNLSLPNIPPWAKWIVGSLLIVALPFYKKFRGVEDELEKTAEMVAETVEKAAEFTEKMVETVEESLPEGSLKEMAKTVEKMAEAVDKGAELAESLIHKIDDVVDEVDSMIEPIIEGGELVANGGSTKAAAAVAVATTPVADLKESS